MAPDEDTSEATMELEVEKKPDRRRAVPSDRDTAERRTAPDSVPPLRTVVPSVTVAMVAR